MDKKDFTLESVYGPRAQQKRKKQEPSEWDKQYAKKLRENPLRTYDQQTLVKIVRAKLNERANGGKFKPSEIQKAIINDLFFYFMKAQDKTSLDVNKGVLMLGSYGAGKTEIMRAMCTTNFEPFDPLLLNKQCLMTSAIEMVEHYNEENHLRYYLNKNLYIDDFGSEQRAKYVAKDEEPVLTKFIELFYMQRQNRLYITTNLNKQQIKEKYGERVYSRLHEMCNFIQLNEKDHRI